MKDPSSSAIQNTKQGCW